VGLSTPVIMTGTVHRPLELADARSMLETQSHPDPPRFHM